MNFKTYEKEVRCWMQKNNLDQNGKSMFFCDGIVNEAQWKTGHKVLYILKEVHDEVGRTGTETSLDFLSEDNDVLQGIETTWRKWVSFARGLDCAITNKRNVCKEDYQLIGKIKQI